MNYPTVMVFAEEPPTRIHQGAVADHSGVIDKHRSLKRLSLPKRNRERKNAM